MVDVLCCAKIETCRDHVYGQSLLFFKRDIRSGIRHDGHLSGLVHQAVLTLHIICFLLVKFAEFFTGQVGLTRIVDMDMHPHPFVATGHHQ